MNLTALLQLVASDSTHLVILLLLIVHFDREKYRHKTLQERLERLERAYKHLEASKRQNEASGGLPDDVDL